MTCGRAPTTSSAPEQAVAIRREARASNQRQSAQPTSGLEILRGGQVSDHAAVGDQTSHDVDALLAAGRDRCRDNGTARSRRGILTAIPQSEESVLTRFLQTPAEASGEAIVPTAATASCLCHARDRPLAQPSRAKASSVSASFAWAPSRLRTPSRPPCLRRSAGHCRACPSSQQRSPIWGHVRGDRSRGLRSSSRGMPVRARPCRAMDAGVARRSRGAARPSATIKDRSVPGSRNGGGPVSV